MLHYAYKDCHGVTFFIRNVNFLRQRTKKSNWYYLVYLQ